MQPPMNPHAYIDPSVPQVYIRHNLLDHHYWDRVFNRGYQQYANFNPHAGFRIPQNSPLLSKKLAPIVYVGGMVGYALAIPVRVGYLGGAILRLAWCDRRSVSARFSEILQAIAGIFSSLFGVICPLVGYQMDRWIYPGIHNPAAVQIRDGLAAEINEDVRVARENAVSAVLPEVRAINAVQLATRTAEIEAELAQLQIQIDDIRAGSAHQVEAAERERTALMERQLAEIRTREGERSTALQRNFDQEMALSNARHAEELTRFRAASQGNCMKK